MAGNKNKTNFKSPKKGSNILCRVSNPTAEMVVKYVNRLPKEIMAEDKFRSIMGTSWFSNEHQAPEQWGLYYIDGTTYYPRFSRDITEKEAERYLNGWLKRLIVINPYTKFKVSNDNGLVISIVKHLEDFPHIKDLKTIIRDIINSKEPFIVNDILANTLNKYSEVLAVTTIDKDKELFDVKLLPDYQDIISKKYMKKKDYFHLFDGIVDDTIDTNFQTIVYGCPGTGKSHMVKGETEGEHGEKTIWYDESGARVEFPTEEQKKTFSNNIFRTTFHPDYDYATFVGCYKPVKDEGGALDYKFVPQVFTNAYVTALRHPEDPVYLIIEEINRGNCAQIFGDLFQLLDRTAGVSDFVIKPGTELSKYLKSEKVPSESLCLPANLHIYATMNTSDQSLFPMDSAFKRRWAMEYKPIEYEHPVASKFTVTIAGKTYKWVDFLKWANFKIREATNSEDKQMGEFFIKSKNIEEKEFVNKVMFYLWNDVCKDYYNPRRVTQQFFMRITSPNENEQDYFTFAELFDKKRNAGSRLLTGFMDYLKAAYLEKHPDEADSASSTAPEA